MKSKWLKYRFTSLYILWSLFFFLRQTYSFTHSVAHSVLERASKSKAKWEWNKKKRIRIGKMGKKKKMTTTTKATMTTKRIAVSSFDVLECEIPIKWAQTNWFVSDFYTPHLMLRFHFFSCSFACLLARFLSYFIQIAQMLTVCTRYYFFFYIFFSGSVCCWFWWWCSLLLLFCLVFIPSLSQPSAMRPFSLFARYIFHIDSNEEKAERRKKHTHTYWTMVYCFVGYLMQTRYTIEKLNTLKTFSSVSVIIANQPTNKQCKSVSVNEKRAKSDWENGKHKTEIEKHKTHRIMDSMEKIVLASKFVRC